MESKDKKKVDRAKERALEVLLNNNHGSYQNLPRTAAWGYPEPYTRDLMICSLGVMTTNNKRLLHSLRRVLEVLAKNQTSGGHISSLVHDPDDRGASDTTPLFLMTVGMYRKYTGEKDFLDSAVKKSLNWMEYQSPANRQLVAQLPTSDWRDEQWVLGYGLFVNTVVYTYLCVLGEYERASIFHKDMERFSITGERQHHHVHEGLVLKHKPYYALWAYKVFRSERFDLLGNSLAILSGIASKTRAKKMIGWIERECRELQKNGDLGVDMAPNFFPYIRPGDPDWIDRYKNYNQPGQYHNGGIWPFICGFYVAALVAAERYKLAEKKLLVLTELVKQVRKADVEFGFNEWLEAKDGSPQGQDWQSWSAAMYLYAAFCVEHKKTPFFDEVRKLSQSVNNGKSSK